MTELSGHDRNTILCALLNHSREWQDKDTYPRVALSMATDPAKLAAQFAFDLETFEMVRSRIDRLQDFSEQHGIFSQFDRDMSETIDYVNSKIEEMGA